jgi:RecJ-like exonuclease
MAILNDQNSPSILLNIVNGLRKCPACLKEISVLADSCPQCGRPKPFKIKIIEDVTITCVKCDETGRIQTKGAYLHCPTCKGTNKITTTMLECEDNNDPQLISIPNLL